MSNDRVAHPNRMGWICRRVLLAVLILAMVLPGARPAYAANLTVNSTADGADATPGDGICQTATVNQCTLRAAIQEANVLEGTDTIGFNIPGGGLQTIVLTSALPAINDSVTIDGTTQPGASCTAWPPTLRIELDGSGTTSANALNFSGIGSSTVRGLVIHSFSIGIELANSSNNAIECNFLGTDASGTQARPNSNYGIQIQQAASGNAIGGPLVSQRNLISSNGTQIGIDNFGSKPSDNTIQNNYIGTDVTGSFGLGAAPSQAISMYGSDANHILGNRIYSTGGPVINDRGGVNISGDIARTSVGNIIQGNAIGVAANGTTATGSVAPAINLYPSGGNSAAISGTIIGGSGPGQGNLLSGNNGEGIYAFANGTTIEGNLIGTQADGTDALGNQASGITIQGSGNVVGGLAAGQRNVIANNAAGVRILGGSGNRIRGNSISNNGGPGIDLGGDGVTLNHQGSATGPNDYQNFPVLKLATSDSGGTRVAGTFNGAPGTLFDIDVYVNPTCDPTSFGEGRTYLGTLVVGTDDGGVGSFDQSFEVNVPEPQGVSATATNRNNGDTSEFSYCRPVSTTNLNWAQAQDIGGGTVQQYITAQPQEKWFRFPVQPGDKVRVDLTGLPGSSLSLHSDPHSIYNGLTNPQSAAVLSAEAADSAFLPSGYLPSGYLPSGYLPSGYLPSGYLPSGYLPSGYLPSGYLPSGYLPSGYLPSGYLPSGYLPSGYLPSGYLPSGYLPSESLPSGYLPSGYLPSGYLPSGYLPSGDLPPDSSDAYATAARRSLIGISTDPSAAVQTIERDTYDTQGDLYVRVVGPYNLSTPFTLGVTVIEGVCGGVQVAPSNLLVISGGAPTGSHKTLILTNSKRLPGTENEVSAAMAKLSELAGRLADVDGVLIDLSDAKYQRVAWAYTQADQYKTCPAAQNNLAAEIKAVIDAYRAANRSGEATTLQYVVLAGGDSVIPFHQVQDVAGLASEKDYVAPVAPMTPSEAGLRSGLVKGQDYYGSQATITQAGHTIALPGLAVGRLVDTAADVAAAVQTYIDTNGVVTPRSSLVTGYDFVGDAAEAVKTELDAGTNSTADTLIQAPGLPPTDRSAWTADQLRAKLLAGNFDIAMLSGHFSAGNLLAADYSSNLSASEIAQSSADLTNVVIMALGCHSGYSIPASDMLTGASPDPDWAKAFLRKGAAGYIAATGYAYGDTDLTEYGERLFVKLAQQLRTGTGPISIGQALVAAKQQYLAQTAQLTGIDEKTVTEMALYGLPMMKINMLGARISPPAETSIAPPPATVPGATPGLSSTAVVLNPVVTTVTKPLTNLNTNTTLNATYLTGEDGVVANPYEPIYPKDIYNVSVAGQVLRGVAFRGGSYTDQSGIVPLTSAPSTETSTPHQSFSSEVFYPTQTWMPNYYDTIGGGPTRLVAIPAQFQSSGPGAIDGTLRTFSTLNMQLYYLPDSWTDPNAPAEVKAAAVSAAPSILGAAAEASDAGVTFSVQAQAEGSAGVKAVWVLYTGKPGSQYYGQWRPLDLTQSTSDPTLWSGILSGVTDASSVLFMVQAVGGAGLTTLATNLGAYYTVTVAGAPTPTPTATSIRLVAPPTSGAYLKSSSFTVELLAAGRPLSGQLVTLNLGGQQAQAATGSNGQATITLRPVAAPGSYALQASFRASASYAGATTSTTFTINKDSTSIALTPAAETIAFNPTLADQPTTIVAVLHDSAGQPLDGKSVVFVVRNASQTIVLARSVNTDYQGKARLGAVPLSLGSYTVDAYFSGTIPVGTNQTLTLSDDYYTSSKQLGAALTIAGTSADTTPPTLNPTVTPNPVLLGGAATATAGATDSGSGVATQSCGTVDTSSVGTKSVICTATDNAGNTATASVSYDVIYNFSGFFQPIDALPTLNVAKAGSGIPVKFSLAGNQGLNVFAAGYPQSQPISCNTTTPSDTVEEVVSASASGLKYDAAANQYIYTWKTNSSWSNTCRQLVVKFIDGRSYSANFKFTK